MNTRSSHLLCKRKTKRDFERNITLDMIASNFKPNLPTQNPISSTPQIPKTTSSISQYEKQNTSELAYLRKRANILLAMTAMTRTRVMVFGEWFCEVKGNGGRVDISWSWV